MGTTLLMVASLGSPLSGHQEVSPTFASILAARAEPISRYRLLVGGAAIEIEIHLEQSNLDADDLLAWIKRAAEAVTTYYGRFPVRSVRVGITQTLDQNRSIHGTTRGDMTGFQGASRMSIGRNVSKADLETDWTMTHELVHMALTSLPDQNRWLEEGLATYVEPIARAQSGQLSESSAWTSMYEGMKQGEPQGGDRGLDKTHTWARTYWGGALFCLIADVDIRRATSNRMGLQDALRAIVASGSTIDTERPLAHVLKIGDTATGTSVLEDLYRSWKDTPVQVDLDRLWTELGIHAGPRRVDFDDNAPLARIRQSITQRHSDSGITTP